MHDGRTEMYTPAESLEHLYIPRRRAAIVAVVLGLGHARRDGGHDLFDVKVQDLVVHLGRGMRGGGDVQERREGEGGDDGLGQLGGVVERVFIWTGPASALISRRQTSEIGRRVRPELQIWI